MKVMIKAPFALFLLLLMTSLFVLQTTPIGSADIVVVPATWAMDLVITSTGASINGQQIGAGSQISFKGRITGTDGKPFAGQWVALNIMPQGTTAESGSQCWVGSAQADANGYFGAGYSVEVRADGLYTNYPAEGYQAGYVQARNGAANTGCQSWATQSTVGKSYSAYAAVSKTAFSSAVSFSVKSEIVPPVDVSDLYGRMATNAIKYRYYDKSACDGQMTSWAPKIESKTSALTRAMQKWYQLLPSVTWQEVTSGEALLIYCESSGQVSESSYDTGHAGTTVYMFDHVTVWFRALGGVVIAEHELGHVLGLPDDPVECQSDYKYLMCSVNAGGTPNILLALARMSQDLLDPSQRELQQLQAVYSGTSPPPLGVPVSFFENPTAGGTIVFNGVTYINGVQHNFPTGTYTSTANPSSGYVFKSWQTTGGVTIASTTSATTTATVTATGALIANFATGASSQLTVTAGSGGTVAGTASGSYAAGSVISVTATASSSSTPFSSWTISGASCTAGLTTSPCAFVMPSNAVTLTANFGNVGGTYAVTLSTVQSNGGITVQGNTYQGSKILQLAAGQYPVFAFPISPYTFSSWTTSGGVSVGAQTQSTTMTVSAAGTLTANFGTGGKNQFSVSAGSGGSVSGTPSGSYVAGTSILVIATASSSSTPFSGWTISGASCSAGTSVTPCTFSMPANPVTLAANFGSIGPPPAVQTAPGQADFALPLLWFPVLRGQKTVWIENAKVANDVAQGIQYVSSTIAQWNREHPSQAIDLVLTVHIQQVGEQRPPDPTTNLAATRDFTRSSPYDVFILSKADMNNIGCGVNFMGEKPVIYLSWQEPYCNTQFSAGGPVSYAPVAVHEISHSLGLADTYGGDWTSKHAMIRGEIMGGTPQFGSLSTLDLYAMWGEAVLYTQGATGGVSAIYLPNDLPYKWYPSAACMADSTCADMANSPPLIMRTNAAAAVSADIFLVTCDQSGCRDTKMQSGTTTRIISPAQFKAVTQSGVYAGRLLVDGTPYPMEKTGPTTFMAPSINVPQGSHIISFEYQQTSGDQWATSLYLLTPSLTLSPVLPNQGWLPWLDTFMANDLFITIVLLSIIAVVTTLIWWRRR